MQALEAGCQFLDGFAVHGLRFPLGRPIHHHHPPIAGRFADTCQREPARRAASALPLTIRSTSSRGSKWRRQLATFACPSSCGVRSTTSRSRSDSGRALPVARGTENHQGLHRGVCGDGAQGLLHRLAPLPIEARAKIGQAKGRGVVQSARVAVMGTVWRTSPTKVSKLMLDANASDAHYAPARR